MQAYENVDPVLAQLRTRIPLLWLNPAARGKTAPAVLAHVGDRLGLGATDISAADARLRRWAPALQRLFPELAASGGIIESALDPLPQPDRICAAPIAGPAYIKRDDALPVAGSIKARGGIFEVLSHAEELARQHGLTRGDDTLALLEPAARAFFARHTIAVGSTGNLGMSIGIMAAALGFQAVVHMSHDARQWKKARLRAHGVTVVEHAGDYSAAVAAGRDAAQASPRAHFVDDENSRTLFLGYAVAALRLRDQLRALGVVVDADHPLVVYLPCGVGGAPGGITFGLKHVFGDAVHCLFAEPCAAPAMLARLASPLPLSVYDLGLDNLTQADGLAVAQASEFVHAAVHELVDGVFTVSDDDLLRVLARLHRAAGLRIEPSAAAAFLGVPLLQHEPGASYLRSLSGSAGGATCTHVFWTTGGALVPRDEYDAFLARGRALLEPGAGQGASGSVAPDGLPARWPDAARRG